MAKPKSAAQSFKPGDRIRLTGQFLRSTGQIAGGEGQKVWTVIACACATCQPYKGKVEFVAVDEENAFQYDDLPKPQMRHFNVNNVSLYGKPTIRDVY